MAEKTKQKMVLFLSINARGKKGRKVQKCTA